MRSPSTDETSSRDVGTLTTTGTSAAGRRPASPLWLLVAASALFFAVAAALLASG